MHAARHPTENAVRPPPRWIARARTWLARDMAGVGDARPDSTRARSVMLNQALLCAIVLVLVAIALVEGLHDDQALFLAGTLIVFAAGAAAFSVSWNRVSRLWVFVLPCLDIVAITLLRVAEPTGGLGLLWAFPAMWLASLGVVGFVVQFLAITSIYWSIVGMASGPFLAYSTLLLPIAILAIAATSFLSTRRFTAQRELLDKQAILLSGALQRAQRQEQLVTEVLDAVDFGVIRISADGVVTVVNEALGRMQQLIPGFGRLDEPLRDAYRADGTTPLPPEERPIVRALRGEVFDNFIVWFGAVDARRWAISMTVRRLRDAHGADAGSVLIARDMTAELTALRARDQLVASVSHELRTPLTSVLGYIDLAVDNLGEPELARKDLEVAARNSERLLEIVSDILAASSSSRFSADMTISPEDVDVAEIAATAAEAWAARADERAITIDVSGLEAARAYADPLRLRQVMDNLLSNAVKYNRDGGSVWLGTATDGVTTWVLVRDTGVGISEPDQARLFERYFRARTGVDGTGLGLSISREIARAHGGDITVRSAPGAGSTFILRLPATAEAVANGAEAGDPTAAVPGPIVVDDGFAEGGRA